MFRIAIIVMTAVRDQPTRIFLSIGSAEIEIICAKIRQNTELALVSSKLEEEEDMNTLDFIKKNKSIVCVCVCVSHTSRSGT